MTSHPVPVRSSRVCRGLNRTGSRRNGWVLAMLPGQAARMRVAPVPRQRARRCTGPRPGSKGPHPRGPDRHGPDRLRGRDEDL